MKDEKTSISTPPSCYQYGDGNKIILTHFHHFSTFLQVTGYNPPHPLSAACCLSSFSFSDFSLSIASFFPYQLQFQRHMFFHGFYFWAFICMPLRCCLNLYCKNIPVELCFAKFIHLVCPMSTVVYESRGKGWNNNGRGSGSGRVQTDIWSNKRYAHTERNRHERWRLWIYAWLLAVYDKILFGKQRLNTDKRTPEGSSLPGFMMLY